MREQFPSVHETFCSGDCGKPQREDYATGYDYFRAMNTYMKNKQRSDKRNGTIKPKPTSPYTQTQIV